VSAQVKVDKNVVRMAQEVQKLEDDISAALNDQTTLQKSQVKPSPAPRCRNS
jgi:hypothetical protein